MLYGFVMENAVQMVDNKKIELKVARRRNDVLKLLLSFEKASKVNMDNTWNNSVKNEIIKAYMYNIY